MEGIIYYFLWFIIFSFLGYLFEVLMTYLLNKKVINKGFLVGPIIPMYGIFSLIVVYLLKGYYNDVLVVMVFGGIIGLIIKYLVSHLFEKIFYHKFWNYKIKYNIEGRICFIDAAIFMIMSTLIIYILEPLLTYFHLGSNRIIIIISLAIFILFTIDVIWSYFEARRICNIASHLEIILNEYTKSRNIKLNKISLRLFKAYPYILNNDRLYKRLEKLKKDFTHFKKLVK